MFKVSKAFFAPQFGKHFKQIDHTYHVGVIDAASFVGMIDLLTEFDQLRTAGLAKSQIRVNRCRSVAHGRIGRCSLDKFVDSLCQFLLAQRPHVPGTDVGHPMQLGIFVELSYLLGNARETDRQNFVESFLQSDKPVIALRVAEDFKQIDKSDYVAVSEVGGRSILDLISTSSGPKFLETIGFHSMAAAA